ncbi:sel1 repeat family protein [Pseudomonas sp. MAFF 730085]|uniref:Sel1 repeat family protein n=1 Tax=Pseudomonas kitaguniensis TaxID=2607908 RepID=A0A5N7JSA9_9PSED|nr:sel1 repeat family protein [Pseudomonas kitaguniensis]MPQ84268.1 sel1 repeat family protein [Pseudomonas kitaguniensis]
MKMDIRFWLFSVRVLVLLACGSGSVAVAASCPSDDFAAFVKEFSATPEVRQAFSASPLLKLEVAADGSKPRVIQKRITSLDADELNVFSLKSGLIVQVKLPNRLIARDQQGSVLKILTFKHSDCWVVNRLEDWSLETVLDAQAQASALPADERALRRGAMFNDLGIYVQSDSSAQLYEAALDSYLDGAQKGSAEAAFAAASISLSGQAPQLATPRIYDLLITASNRIADAGVALAEFYCDEGEYDKSRACINPQKSLASLEGAARQGSASALIQLGESYETGKLVSRDLPRAMACYLDVEKSQREIGARAVARLAMQGVAANSAIQCL